MIRDGLRPTEGLYWALRAGWSPEGEPDKDPGAAGQTSLTLRRRVTGRRARGVLPHRMLPVAWLGVSVAHQGQGLGQRLLAQALRDCYEGGKVFAFVAVILDCLKAAKSFYQKYDFAELPGHPYRLYLSAQQLEALMAEE